MSSGTVIVNQPGVYLVDSDGNVITLGDGDSIGSAEGVLVMGKDGSTARLLRAASDGTLRIDPVGTTTQPISAASLPLPAGAATEATLASVKNTDGIKKITDALPVGDNIIGRTKITDGTSLLSITTGGEAKMVLYDDVNNVALAVLDGGAIPANTRSLLAAGKDESGNARTLMTVEDENQVGLHRLAITGNVAVVVQPPPTGGSLVTIPADNPLTVSGTHDTEYTITSGKSFYIQQLICGAEGDPTEKGSKIEVLFNNGTEHPISRVYITGFSEYFQFPDVNEARDGTSLTGNGTNKIVVRRIRLSGTSQEIDAVVRGYEL